MKNDKIFRLAALLLCAALCLGLTACGDGDTGPTYVDGPTFTIAVAQEPDSLNPLTAQSALSQEFFLLAYDPLWRLGADGQPEPCLAEDWSLSSDHRTWTIRLRQDAMFSDGVAVTAADVLFSYELLRRSGTLYTDYFDGISAIRQADDYTVVISTDYVKGDMLYNPAPILPRHIWRSYDFDPAAFDNASMIGSGPFVYSASGSGEEGWRFDARADYFGGAPSIGSVFFRRYATPTGAGKAVASGDADAGFGMTDVQLTTLENVPGVELIQAVLPGAEQMLLALNTRTDLLGNDVMRRAVEFGADRTWILSMSVGSAGVTGSSFFSPGHAFFARPDGLRTYEPNTALALFQSAGCMDTDGDGILDYGPRAAKLTFRLYSSNQDEWASTAATILAADLGEIGAQVNWHRTDSSIASVCGEDDDWDMCVLGWQGSYSAAVTATRFRDELGTLTGWSDPSYESDLSLLRSAEDAAVALGYARRLQQTAYDSAAVIVLGCPVDVQAVRSDRWTGYEDILAGGGGIFGIGSADFYLSLRPRTAEAE